jgi:hypothetical protein
MVFATDVKNCEAKKAKCSTLTKCLEGSEPDSTKSNADCKAGTCVAAADDAACCKKVVMAKCSTMKVADCGTGMEKDTSKDTTDCAGVACAASDAAACCMTKKVASSSSVAPTTTAAAVAAKKPTKVQGSVAMAIELPAGQTAKQFMEDAKVKTGVAAALENQYGYATGTVKDVALTEVTARRLGTQRRLAATDFKVAYSVESTGDAAAVKAIEDKMKKELTAEDKTAFATKMKTEIETATTKTYTVTVKSAKHEGTVTPKPDSTTAAVEQASFARSSAEPAFLLAVVTALAYAGL